MDLRIGAVVGHVDRNRRGVDVGSPLVDVLDVEGVHT